MNEIDQQYQQVVDKLAKELLQLSPREMLEQPDYGSLTRQADKKELKIGFWHYAFNDEKHHIVFKTDRRCFLFFCKSYISGVVFGSHTSPRLMTPKEIGDYD